MIEDTERRVYFTISVSGIFLNVLISFSVPLW
jgi:hypothetical protein